MQQRISALIRRKRAQMPSLRGAANKAGPSRGGWALVLTRWPFPADSASQCWCKHGVRTFDPRAGKRAKATMKRDGFLILPSLRTTYEVVFLALPMSYRENRGSDSNRLPRRWPKNVSQHATSNAHHGTRFPDAPQRPLAKSTERRAVPSSVYSWDSNPWSHVRVTNSPMENARVPQCFTEA
jgi:hypothetical protein